MMFYRQNIQDSLDYLDRCMQESIEDGDIPEGSNGHDHVVNIYMMRKILNYLMQEPNRPRS